MEYKNKLIYTRNIKEINSQLRFKEFNKKKKKKLIICESSNVKAWENYLEKEYITITKLNTTTLTYNDLDKYTFIILPIQVLTSLDYQQNFQNYINNELSLTNYTKALNTIKYEQSLNSNYKKNGNIIYQTLDLSIIIFDNLYKNVPYHMINLFTSEYKFFMSKNYYKDKLEDSIGIFSNFLDLTLEEDEDIGSILSNIYCYYKTVNSIKERNILLDYNEHDKRMLNLIKKNVNIYEYNSKKMSRDISENLYESICLNYSKMKYKYIEKIQDKINYDNTCPICLNDLVMDNDCSNIAVTSCSHLFCYDCILNNMYINDKCPKCRKILTSNDINLVGNMIINKYSSLNELTPIKNGGIKLNHLFKEMMTSTNEFNVTNKVNCVIISNYMESIQNIYNFINSLGIKCTKVVSKRKQFEIHNGIHIIHYDTIINIKYLDKHVTKFIFLDKPKELNHYRDELLECINSSGHSTTDLELVSFEFNPLSKSKT